MAGMRLVRMAMSSALIGVTFKEWTHSCLMTELSAQICATAIATWDFLTPLLQMVTYLFVIGALES